MICVLHQLVWVIQPRRMRLQYIFAHVEDRINACRVVVETPEGKDLGSIDMRLNKMDLTEIGWEVMNCTDLAQNSNK